MLIHGMIFLIKSSLLFEELTILNQQIFLKISNNTKIYLSMDIWALVYKSIRKYHYLQKSTMFILLPLIS